MASNAAIRPARSTDRHALQSLQTNLAEPSPTTLTAALAGVGTVLVAAPSGELPPVGYCIGVPGDDTAWIAELVVAPAHRRNGWGTKLLAACCQSLHDDHDSARLAVAPDNHTAQSLYRARGFRQLCQVDDYYEDGPAIIFERRFNE